MKTERGVEGRLDVMWSHVYAAIEAGHVVEPSQFEPGIPLEEQAHQHILNIHFYESLLRVAYGVMPVLDVTLEAPFRLTGVDASFLDSSGGELIGFESVHHRDETITGFADPSIGVLWHAIRMKSSAGHYLNVGASVGIPLGGTEPDPFAAGMEGRSHQHMFFGYGVFTPRLEARYIYTTGSYRWGGWTKARLALYESSRNYKPPGSYQLAMGGQYHTDWSGFWFGFEPRFLAETAAQWASREAENSGRIDFSIAGMFGWTWGGGVTTTISVQRMIKTMSASGNQLELPWTFSLGVGWRGVVVSE